MTGIDNTPNQVLGQVREEIDLLDTQMHALLMKRSEIIDRLIKVKSQQGGGSAFRPGREAAMMRILAERHAGNLPLETIESIWRIIIATFTYAQAPYSVHIDMSGQEQKAWDSARFHFGFTVPLVNHLSSQDAIRGVIGSTGDLAMVPIRDTPNEVAWWEALIGANTPKIIARVPFLDRRNHPAGSPFFVISKPLAEATSRETVLCAVTTDQWDEKLSSVIKDHEGTLIARSKIKTGLSACIALPEPHDSKSLDSALKSAGLTDVQVEEIGSHARPYVVQ